MRKDRIRCAWCGRYFKASAKKVERLTFRGIGLTEYFTECPICGYSLDLAAKEVPPKIRREISKNLQKK